MSTSGSYDYSATAADVIQYALENIGEIAAGESVTSSDSALCLKRLNFIVKQMQGRSDQAPGLKLWSRQRLTLFLAKGQQTYTVGPAATDSRATAQYGRTTLSSAAIATATTLSITSNTDTTTYPGTTITMTASDIIGIVLNDGTIQWTTISGTPATTATIANALTGAAAAGNYVYWFTSRAQRFPVLEFAYLRDKNLTDIPLTVFTDVVGYESIPDKHSTGDPTAILVEPQRMNTRITLDSQPTDVTRQIGLTVLYPAEDYDSTTNDIALPQEWFSALEWELAFRIAPAFGAKWTDAMQANYKQAMEISRNLNDENSSAFFQPGAQ